MPYQPAVLGTARLNNFRLNYLSAALSAIRETRVRILIGGVLANGRVRLASLTIHDVANDEPDSCSFTVDTAPWPTVGQEVRVTLNSNTPRHLFNGAVQTAETTFEGDRPKRQVVHVSAADDLAAMDKLPVGAWTNVSASTVALELLAGFAPGFTGAHVAAGLPAVSIVLDGSEGWSGALRQIAGLIGGGFYVEDRDLHLFLEEWTDAPDPITGADPFAHDPAITQALDDSQLRTRVYGRGHGEPLVSDVLAGETILPIENAAAWFSAIGGRAITEDAQRLTYTGVQAGGAGTVAGVSAAPSAAPSLTAAVGAGLNQGVYQSAYTFVTASGESLPSPLGTVTLGTAAAAPTSAPTTDLTLTGAGTFAYTVGDTINEVYTYSAGINNGDYSRMTAASPATSFVAVNAGDGRPQAPLLTMPHSTDPTITYVILWRQVNGGGYYRINDTGNVPGSTWTWRDGTFPNGGLLPAAYRQILSSGIATGPSGTTQRKIYRTVVNGSQLKLQQTIANNTSTTGVQDATADGSLGATAPVTDTSGLTTVAGQVNAGSPTLLLSGTGAFSATGGWTMNGIRYTGISGNTLTGIPATGPGSIATTIPYGTAIVAAPALTGVSGLVRARPRGAAILVWVQRDDVAAQTAAAARETTAVYTSDGIHEYLVSDERRNEASLTALCDAYLVLFAQPLVTVGYATRDVKTKSGKELVVTLTVPAISQTLTIQEVAITEIDLVPGTPPKFTATASSLRYSLEGMLRRLSGLLES